jgi:dihydrolipoamide dehydrogenase
VKVGRFPFRAHGRNIADGETTGFVKIVGDAVSGQILGTSIFGAKASELIHEAALAIGADLDVSAIAQAVHAHPTMMEALQEAAEDADGLAIHLLRTEVKVGAK